MEETDKTYLWLVLITFIGLALAMVFTGMELSELKENIPGAADPFTSG